MVAHVPCILLYTSIVVEEWHGLHRKENVKHDDDNNTPKNITGQL